MLNIFDWLRSRSAMGRTATDIYGSIVAQARAPAFYTEFGVADVAEKRYEMIVLHLVIVLERLRALDSPEANALRQALVEEFVRDLDGSMREMAVGDTKVPAKVRKAAGGLLDRDVLYRQAFAAIADGGGQGCDGDDTMTVEGLLGELIFDGNGLQPVEPMVRYVHTARAALVAWSPGDDAAALPFPSAAGISEMVA